MAAGISIQKLLSDVDQGSNVATQIDDRLSQELIFALVGPVGSGVSTAAGMIRDLLSTEFHYAVEPVIKLSDIIKAEAHRVGGRSVERDHLDDYIETMQQIGNDLRKQYGPFYLTEKVVEKICKIRGEQGGYDSAGIQVPGRRAFVLDSLKNMEELTSLIHEGALTGRVRLLAGI